MRILKHILKGIFTIIIIISLFVLIIYFTKQAKYDDFKINKLIEFHRAAEKK